MTRTIRVWDSRTGTWLPAGQIAELAPILDITSLTAPPVVTPLAPGGEASTNALAIWSFSLAMASLCCCGCLSFPAIILGAIALTQIHARHEGGRGLAIAGIVIAIAALAIHFLGSLLWWFCHGPWPHIHGTMRFT